MPKRKLNYKPGDWVAVSLDPEGYAVGRIARTARTPKDPSGCWSATDAPFWKDMHAVLAKLE